jgi:hypothetical protein
VHALVDVDWNLNIDVLPKDLRQDLRLEKRSTKSPLLDILLVCRSFYFAGIAAFFGENVLRFESVSHLDRLTAILDLDRRRCIRHVLFHSHFHGGVLWNLDLVALGERYDSPRHSLSLMQALIPPTVSGSASASRNSRRSRQRE